MIKKTITKKTVRMNDDRTGSMTGAPSPKERMMMDKKVMTKMPMAKTITKAMSKFKVMPKNTKVANSTPMMKKKK